MLIEFLGAPGTGKTTLAVALANELCARGHDAAVVGMDSPAELGRYAKIGRDLLETGPWIVANPTQAWRAVRLMRLFPQRGWLPALSRLRYWLRTVARVRQGARIANVVIVDQGCFQGIASWALFSAKLDPAVVRAVVPTLPRPGLLVVLRLPDELIRARIRARQYAHRQIDRLLLADDRWIRAAAATVAQVEEAARENGCAIVRLDSSSVEAAAVLTEQVLPFLAAGPHVAAERRL